MFLPKVFFVLRTMTATLDVTLLVTLLGHFIGHFAWLQSRSRGFVSSNAETQDEEIDAFRVFVQHMGRAQGQQKATNA